MYTGRENGGFLMNKIDAGEGFSRHHHVYTV